jgi:hypothetical protein
MPNKGVALTHAHKWKYVKQIFQKGMMTKEQRQLKCIKELTKGKRWND